MRQAVRWHSLQNCVPVLRTISSCLPCRDLTRSLLWTTLHDDSDGLVRTFRVIYPHRAALVASEVRDIRLGGWTRKPSTFIPTHRAEAIGHNPPHPQVAKAMPILADARWPSYGRVSGNPLGKSGTFTPSSIHSVVARQALVRDYLDSVFVVARGSSHMDAVGEILNADELAHWRRPSSDLNGGLRISNSSLPRRKAFNPREHGGTPWQPEPNLE